MESTVRPATLPDVSEFGSLLSVTIDPAAAVAALRDSGLSVEVVGAEEDWRQLIVSPRDNKSGRLTMVLKTREVDQLFFRKTTPNLIRRIAQLPAQDLERQRDLQRLIPHLGVCLELTAEPAFSERGEFIEAMTLLARLIDGVFVIPAGFLDCESREILTAAGMCNPKAHLPVIPDFPAGVEDDYSPDEAFEGTFDPPIARRVAERMYTMLTVAYRGVLDINQERPERQVRLTQLGDWFWTLEVGHELEEYERYILDQPLGAITREQAQQLSQQFESVVVLAWSLGLVELPRHDEFVQAKKLADLLGLLREDTRFVIDSAELRSELDLRAAADQMMAVHWRLREFELSPRPVDFAGMCRDSWFGSIDLSSLPIIEGDLAIAGQPITRADPATRNRAQIAIQHRHRAINWVCGHHPVFSKVDIST